MDRYAQVVERLKGPVVPINICFTATGGIDYPAQRRYEDPWLKRATELNWLFSIKTAIQLHGLFPEEYLGAFQSPDQAKRDEVHQCLERVFGPIEPVEL